MGHPATIHRFPSPYPAANVMGRARQAAAEFDFSDKPILDAIDMANAKTLLGVSKYVSEGGRALINFVDMNRAAARQAGIETIAVELSGILDAGKIDQVRDTLEEGLRRGRGAEVSIDGLSYLKRSEKLLSEATSGLSGYGGSSLGLSGSRVLSAPMPSSSNELLILGGIGIIVIGIIAVIYSSSK